MDIIKIQIGGDGVPRIICPACRRAAEVTSSDWVEARIVAHSNCAMTEGVALSQFMSPTGKVIQFPYGRGRYSAPVDYASLEVPSASTNVTRCRREGRMEKVARAWLELSPARAGNFWTDGRTISSYTLALGRLLGDTIYVIEKPVIEKPSRSVTTSGHYNTVLKVLAKERIPYEIIANLPHGLESP